MIRRWRLMWLAGGLLSVMSMLGQAQVSITAALAPSSVNISAEAVDLGAGCPITGKIPISTNVVIEVMHLCEPAKWRPSPAPTKTCSSRLIPVLGIRFRGLQDLVFAESIALSSQHFHMRLLHTLDDAHGDRQDIQAIERSEWCTEGASVRPYVLPYGTCVEPRQFAAAFNYNTPLNNKILTNGFSFFVRLSGKSPKDFNFEKAAGDVRNSFGRALTIWTSGLQENSALLTPATKAFVQARTSTSSGGYTLLLPPQVVRLDCPHAATFVVELNFGGDETFPSKSHFLTLAKARVEGRTIALNMRDVRCFMTMPNFKAGQLALKDEHCTNLIPILTHELGHAFGIDHIPVIDGLALMNPVLSDQATVPNGADVKAFVLALEKSVTGARPGELEFRQASGLLAPPDWVVEHPKDVEDR